MKNSITSDLILKIIDPDLPLRLKIGASSEGLEALFDPNHGSLKTQKWHPIGYSSRFLSDYKERYAQIKKVTDSLYSSWSRDFPRIFI